MQVDTFIGKVGDVVEFEFKSSSGKSVRIQHKIEQDSTAMVVYNNSNRRRAFNSVGYAFLHCAKHEDVTIIQQRRFIKGIELVAIFQPKVQ